jgi:hypothetical protein
MMQPVTYRITIGAATYSAGQPTRLVDLRHQAALDVPVNSCRLVLSPPLDLTIAPQDRVTVELGYGETRSLVFTGLVATVEWAISRVVIHATGAFRALLAARLNLAFTQPAAKDIVADIAGRLKLDRGTVEAGLTFAGYTLGANRSAYDQVRELALQCGFDLYADPEDKLVFARYNPATTHTLAYAVNILACRLDTPDTPVSGAEVYGESPVSTGQGSDAATWLTKKEITGSAGSKDGRVVRRVDPTARTQEVAGQIATALLAGRCRQRRGHLTLPGAPAIRLGDAVEVTDMPVLAQNGTYKLTGVQHTLNNHTGFVTALAVEEV